MVAKIQKLPPETQEVLKLAACIGNQFLLETLAVISEASARETALTLQEAVVEGLIEPLGAEYKTVLLEPLENEKNQVGHLKLEYHFSHDRIQQAAYSLIPDEFKQRVHLQIGQLLLQNTPESQTEEKIFDIVNQLNHGIEFIYNQQQRDKIANLNLIAGQKAKSSAAYQPALIYLQQGLVWLGINGWQTQYETAQALSVEAAEAAYLCGQFEEMESLVAVVLQKARRILDQVRPYEVKIQACIARKKYQEAIETGLAILKLLGVRLPKNPSKLDVLLGMVKTKLLLTGKQIENLLALPEIIDPYKLAAMCILSSISSAAYLTVPELLPLIVSKLVDLSVKHGNSSESAYGYAGYGLIMCGVVGDINFGYQFGQLALSLLSRLNVKERRARTLFVVNSFIRHWQEHVRETLQSFLEAYSSGLETGDLEFAAYSAHHYSYHSYFIGTKLEQIELEMSTYGDAIAQFKQETPLYLNKIYRQAVLNLMGRSDHPCCLTGESYNEEKNLLFHLSINDRYTSFQLYLNKLILSYIFEDYSQAVENTIIAEQLLLNSTLGLLAVSVFYFYNSLVHLAVFSNANNKLQQKRILKKVVANQNKMKRWAEYAPMNYLHKFYLVEAERYRVLGQENQAMDYYDRAIALARENQYLQEEALAYELAAKFYLSQGKKLIARTYLQEAHYRYLCWGAIAKVKDLENRYPQLLPKSETSLRGSGNSKTSVTSTSGSKSSETLDLATVIKGSQAISGEIVLEQLLMKLMKILLQNTGALPSDRCLDMRSLSLLTDPTPQAIACDSCVSPGDYFWEIDTESKKAWASGKSRLPFSAATPAI